MEIARLTKEVRKPEFFDISAGHSNFDLVDQLFEDERSIKRLQAIRRLFSLARTVDCQTLIVEHLEPSGSILEECEDILGRYADYIMEGLVRLSFWTEKFDDVDGLSKSFSPEGGAILKLDSVPSKLVDCGGEQRRPYFAWHIYEAVFVKYDHPNNCVPIEKEFGFSVGSNEYKIRGVFYCQQNSLNKACAQVALRSIILNITSKSDVSYREIHELARDGGGDFDPGEGLSAEKIQNVLEGFGIRYESLDYSVVEDPGIDKLIRAVALLFKENDQSLKPTQRLSLHRRIVSAILNKGNNELDRLASSTIDLKVSDLGGLNEELSESQLQKIEDVFAAHPLNFEEFAFRSVLTKVQQQFPYQKYLYAGVESGGGALLGFGLSVSEEENDGSHIVPVFGHTFNKDTWVPNATNAYFRVGKDTQYVTSSNWLSSFLMHDDNFGPNYILPKSYVQPEQVSYVLSILRKGAVYGALKAEAMGIDFLNSFSGILKSIGSSWPLRLLSSIAREEVVLRAVCVSREEYANSLKHSADWKGKLEDSKMPDLLEQTLPKILWMIEFSIPELFPANQRKIGELIFDATTLPDLKRRPDYGIFMLARYPKLYILKRRSKAGKETFVSFKSTLEDHLPVFTFEK